MFHFAVTFIYEALLLLSALAGFWRWRISDRATRIFTIVMAATFIVEISATVLAKVYHKNNLLLYRVFMPLELLGYCLYLNYCIPQLRRRNIGWVAGIAGITTAISFELFFPKDYGGRHFVMVENVVIICGCLYACFTMLLREDDAPPTRYIHFWLVASLLFFFCFSFLSLALYNAEDPSRYAINHMLNLLIIVGNIGMLIGVLYAFIRLPKLLPTT